MYLGGGTSTSWSASAQFGAASNEDPGQEQTPTSYTPGDLIMNVGGMGGINTRSALPPAIAGAPCVIENGNLYVLGGYSGTNMVTDAVNRLAGI